MLELGTPIRPERKVICGATLRKKRQFFEGVSLTMSREYLPYSTCITFQRKVAIRQKLVEQNS